MNFEPRAITAEEVPAFRTCISIGFGHDYKPDLDERFLSLMPLKRTVAVFDGEQVVGTLGDFDLQLTVPGGEQLAMAGTTMVTVRATHTRKGILRSMVRKHLDNAVERGEPLAGLWASEPGIYGRFGFGLASENHDTKVDARHVTTPVPAAGIEISMIEADQIPEVVAPYWSRIARERNGFIDRGEARWQDIMNDVEAFRGGASASRHLIARRADEVVGYLEYRQSSKWNEFVAQGSVSISTLFASDLDAHMALWAYALNVDLFPNVDFWNGTIDDPLAAQLRESRAVRRVVTDALYVRILDVEKALTARAYERDGQIVLAIEDDMGYASGTYELSVVDGQAAIVPTSGPADVSLGCRELGALYLGRPCVDLYATTGHIKGSVESIRLLGQLFATGRAPWCPEMF